MKYYKAAKNNSNVGFWEKCTGASEQAAKAEATKMCVYTDDIACIGIARDNVGECIDTIAEKRNGKWANC